ncbi:hypothetical protein P154DRAFT_602322, partial [Amniculicola lignicola CBS 123094]
SEAALSTFGFPRSIAASKAALPIAKIEASRITTICIAIWGIYMRGHSEGRNILAASIGWMALVNRVVFCKEGAAGFVKWRPTYQGVVAL